MKTRTLIIDDMPLSRARTRRYLEDETDIEIVGEYGDGEAAIAAIAEQRPDLIFLDVQMPGMSGFELLEKVPTDERPAVVFITAFDEFAVPAFEVRAVDYLLKPFDHERLKQALARVRERLNTGENRKKPLSRFAVKSVGKTVFVDVDAVDWIETAGNYLCLHAGGDTHLVRETMAQVESQLDPQRFARIHRSTIVRIDRIQSMQPLFNGDRCVTLHDGTQLTLSRSYREKIDALLSA
ncbi:MAG TPA: LytTR family DNA-binding domain-containing protein [Gammaproteobacteria bacterium]|nr:LytTR family DNA-binding domain-containing protein [Gammaproteobacteria bacterium]